MSFFPGKGTYMSRKSGIIKKRVIWTKDGSYLTEPISKECANWILCPRSKGIDEDDEDDGPQPFPGPCKLSPERIDADQMNELHYENDGMESRPGSEYDSGHGNDDDNGSGNDNNSGKGSGNGSGSGNGGDNGNGSQDGDGNGSGNGNGNGNGTGAGSGNGDGNGSGSGSGNADGNGNGNGNDNGDGNGNGNGDNNGNGDGNGFGDNNNNDRGENKDDDMEGDMERIARSGESNFEPIPGPSGVNYGASTSGGGLPSSFEDDEEGKRPRKKVCGPAIDYSDYFFDEDDDDEDFDDFGMDPNNNAGFFNTLLPPPLQHHDYVRSFEYVRQPASNISLADWNEAGPSGLNLRSSSLRTDPDGHASVNMEAGPSETNFRADPSGSSMSITPVIDDPSISASMLSVPSSSGANRASFPSTDSDLSSSCSHHSLVDRYTHMNISGCEDQTDEECAFSESDDCVGELEED